jgi:hypothetical protein
VGCPLLAQCTQSQNYQKLIQRHLWEGCVEEADHLRHTSEVKEIYKSHLIQQVEQNQMAFCNNSPSLFCII